MATKVFGASIKRTEDPRLITGAAKYLDDLQLPGVLHAAVLRSPYAHAKIKRINTRKAARAPGVVAVFTGADFKDLPALPCAWQAGGVKNNANTPRVLEIDNVTFTGAGVAVVVAEDRYAAWAIPPRRSLQNEYRDLLAELAEAYAALGRYAEAIHAGEAALEVDPLLESVYRQLMRYHYCAGDKGQALKVYRNCTKLFDELFGEGPTPQTKRLFEAISNNAEL